MGGELMGILWVMPAYLPACLVPIASLLSTTARPLVSTATRTRLIKRKLLWCQPAVDRLRNEARRGSTGEKKLGIVFLFVVVVVTSGYLVGYAERIFGVGLLKGRDQGAANVVVSDCEIPYEKGVRGG
ncbi:hypothetical protein QBC41DRAFT_309294 [Cercophora samala]|uniref:Uncharacterized protein n=1 Tax=Cercophora samala TaxID=330535 RepID=A0AA39ZNV8_9PEZI|nr:hypothetical protein QBC41DRAFT_309294 [Cercophora samala]